VEYTGSRRAIGATGEAGGLRPPELPGSTKAAGAMNGGAERWGGGPAGADAPLS
jgi:hypothetical protein